MSGSDKDDPQQGGDLVAFPGSSFDDSDTWSVGEDIVWFDPDSLAQRSAIGAKQRLAGWWCPDDMDPQGTPSTPCWGALQPSVLPLPAKAPPLWNDPDLPLVRRWAKTASMAIVSPYCGSAYALLDQMLESLVVSNLFEREPEVHRALLVSQRSAWAWWDDLSRRWQHTYTPEGHPVDARHPDFARNWLLVSWDVWQQDRQALEDWLDQSAAQKVLGFHLPPGDSEAVEMVRDARSLCERKGIKCLVAGDSASFDALAWDPRDRLSLLAGARGPERYVLAWGEGHRGSDTLNWDAATGVFYF